MEKEQPRGRIFSERKKKRKICIGRDEGISGRAIVRRGKSMHKGKKGSVRTLQKFLLDARNRAIGKKRMREEQEETAGCRKTNVDREKTD